MPPVPPMLAVALSALVGAIAFAWGALRTAFGRLRMLAREERTETPELASVLLAALWAGQLALRPQFLDSSPYLHALRDLVGARAALTAVTALLVLQGLAMTFGAPPSALIRSGPGGEADARRWVMARIALFGVAVALWTAAAGLLSFRALNLVGSGIHGAAAVACIARMVRLAADYRDARYRRAAEVKLRIVDDRTTAAAAAAARTAEPSTAAKAAKSRAA